LKLVLICVGRMSQRHLQEGVEEFTTRLRRYLPLELIELKEEKAGKKPDVDRVRDREGLRILEKIPARGPVIVLDERGRGLDSAGMARLVEKEMLSGTEYLTWIIGGPYGLSDQVRKRADRILSLSEMTFPHQMVRLILAEQLYRAMTIIRREPYHHS